MMLVLAGLLLTPLLLLLFNSAEQSQAIAFIFPALISLFLYLVFSRLIGKPEGNSFSYDEAAVCVTLSWIVICAISALPVMILHGLSFTHAYFEAMSGYTTTGLTMIDYNTATDMLFLWRSIMQFAGGAGIAVLLIALGSGVMGAGLTSAEGKADLLVPNVKNSARLVTVIYSAYAVVGLLAYKLAGMGWFDAVNHTFAALSTGGFSTHAESIAWFNSRPIEAITLVLMILGNLNFLNAYILFRGKFISFLRNGEIKVQMFIIPLVTVLLMLTLTIRLYGSLGTGFRIALFETVSALTTTGLTSTGYEIWSVFGLFVLTVLMLIGGGGNSTAGGIKQFRFYFIYKSFLQILREMTSPGIRIVKTPYWWGDKKLYITDNIIRSLFVFLIAYLALYVFGVSLMIFYGIGLKEAVFEFASTLSNSGLSLGITNPALPLPVVWCQIVCMFFGRLEIMIVFIALGRIFRDSKRIFI
jgi:trk system potassium uptake protein TrkH